MKVKIRKDLFGGITFLIFAVVIWFLIPSQIEITTNKTINSQTFPQLLAIVIFFASCVLIIKDIRRIIRNDDSSIIILNLHTEFKSALVIILLLAYALLVEYIGFLVTSIAFSIAMLIITKCKKTSYYIILTAICFGVYYIFKCLLLVQLP